MYKRVFGSAAALAMMLTTASAPAPQAAGASAVRAVCCKCVDGSQQKVSLDSRTAPWRVATGSGAAAPVVNATPDPGWSPLAPAGWVKPASATTSAATYTYTLTIVVPRCVIGGRVSIKGQFGADNSATLWLGTTQISATSGGINGFKAPNFGSFSTSLNSGTHVLRMVVSNAGGPTGMILSGAVITECPRSPELGAAVTGGEPAVACSCDEAKAVG